MRVVWASQVDGVMLGPECLTFQKYQERVSRGAGKENVMGNPSQYTSILSEGRTHDLRLPSKETVVQLYLVVNKLVSQY